MPTLYAPTTQNAIQKTLDASLDAGVTAAATFNNMTGVQNLPGIFVVDRVDSNGVETPSKREYISFQTTSGSNVQTLVRGLAGSTDQDHAVGAIVEFIPDVTWAQDLRDHLTTEHNTDGTHSDIHADSIELGGSGATVTSIIDDDTFATASATTLATSESTKAYVDANAGDWKDLGYTLTYASADDPTYTATVAGVNLTSVISPGMRLRVSQSTGGTKYFIVTAVAFSTNTTITLYGGTDYDLNNEAISSPVFSSVKAPVGFPLDPTKWSVQTLDTSNRTQTNATGGTWYNLGSISISIPIGLWSVSYQVAFGTNRTSSNSGFSIVTLSTGNNTDSDTHFRSFVYATVALHLITNATRQKVLSLGSKTSYYLNAAAFNNNDTTIEFRGAECPTIIRAVSAYL